MSIERRQKIIRMVFAHWKRIALAALCMVVVAGANGSMALLVKPVLDDIFIARDNTKLLFIPGLAVLVFFLKGAGSYGSEYLMNHVGQRIIRDFQDTLYEKIMNLPIAYIHKEKTGALMSRITNDVNIIKGMVSTAVISLFRDSFSVVAFLFVIFYRDWKLALGAFIVLPVAFYPIVIFGKESANFPQDPRKPWQILTPFCMKPFPGQKSLKFSTFSPLKRPDLRKKPENCSVWR